MVSVITRVSELTFSKSIVLTVSLSVAESSVSVKWTTWSCTLTTLPSRLVSVQCAPLIFCKHCPCLINNLDVSGTLKHKFQLMFILSRTTSPIPSNPLFPDLLTQLHTVVEEDWLVCQEHVLDNYFIPLQHTEWRHNESKMSKNKQFPTISSILFLANEQLYWKHFPSFSFSPISRIRGWVFHWEEWSSSTQSTVETIYSSLHSIKIQFVFSKAVSLSNIHFQIW